MHDPISPVVLRFTLPVDLENATRVRVHLSADQRFEWFIDGERMGMGPDRSDLEHWSFHSYDLSLPAGRHEIAATVWWLGPLMPQAQTTHRPGFILAAERADSGGVQATAENLAAKFDTGRADWRVQRVTNWSFASKEMRTCHMIGPMQIVDGRRQRYDDPVPPRVLEAGAECNIYGEIRSPQRLYPSPLPDMKYLPRGLHRVRAAGAGAGAVKDAVDEPVIRQEQTAERVTDPWQRLLDEQRPLTLAPGQTQWAVFDLDDYACGFPAARLRGSGQIEIEWAESLFVPDAAAPFVHKGQRDEVVSKQFFGFGDRFIAGPAQSDFAGYWWRSGRYLRVTATAGAEPLVIEQVGMFETGYPCQDDSAWSSDDAGLDGILPLAWRGAETSMHEVYADSPYYEQMMYVGDTRVQMLINHVTGLDDRLVKRGIELLDWSRQRTGFVAERYPSTPFQMSVTFSMIWVGMVRDHAWWRNDPAWVQARLPGMRSMLEAVLALRDAEGWLTRLPGWSFVDWVKGHGWDNGLPPGATDDCPVESVSCLINLHLMAALRGATDLEQWHGEALLAERYAGLAEELAAKITRRFWRADAGLLADTDRVDGTDALSEHAQCLALLTDTLPPADRERCFAGLVSDPRLARTTIYFSHYLFETYQRFGRGDLILERLTFFKEMAGRGLKTPVEQPEPTRSDCHAWGSHPLFHVHASLAGVRPAAPGFAAVDVRPSPGLLQRFSSRIPHPKGTIAVDYHVDEAGQPVVKIDLPPATPGTLFWAGQQFPILPGQSIRVAGSTLSAAMT